MADLKADNEKIIAEARKEKDIILKEAKEMKEKIIAEAKKKPIQKAQKSIEHARQQIQSEKAAAINDIKKQVAELSVMIAEKVIKKELGNKGEAGKNGGWFSRRYQAELTYGSKCNIRSVCQSLFLDWQKKKRCWMC